MCVLHFPLWCYFLLKQQHYSIADLIYLWHIYWGLAFGVHYIVAWNYTSLDDYHALPHAGAFCLCGTMSTQQTCTHLLQICLSILLIHTFLGLLEGAQVVPRWPHGLQCDLSHAHQQINLRFRANLQIVLWLTHWNIFSRHAYGPMIIIWMSHLSYRSAWYLLPYQMV